MAKTRLEVAQLVKVMQSVRHNDRGPLEKLGTCGIPFILNYNDPTTGEFPLGVAASQQDPELVRVSVLSKYVADFLIESFPVY